MHRTTSTLLEALRANDMERVCDARRTWLREGCPDLTEETTGGPSHRNFCDRLRSWRELRGYTLRDLSDRTGIGRTRLFRIETGGDPRMGEWKCLQRALSLSERDAREMEALVPALAGGG
jgi:hypothetical protein